MRQYAAWLTIGALMLAVGACSTQTSQGGGGGVSAPPSSPLSKIQVGMHKKQVQDILGTPSDENSYPTGKAFIPFYFGNDARRTAWYYKGMGHVVFADGNVFGGGDPEVIRVDYDPTESGVARR